MGIPVPQTLLHTLLIQSASQEAQRPRPVWGCFVGDSSARLQYTKGKFCAVIKVYPCRQYCSYMENCIYGFKPQR